MPVMVAVKDEQGLGNMSLELKREGRSARGEKRSLGCQESRERRKEERQRLQMSCHVGMGGGRMKVGQGGQEARR